MQTYEQERYPGETPARRVRRELADARAGVAGTHKLISEELPFLFDQQQYHYPQNRHRRGYEIEPTDDTLYADWQFKKGQVLLNAPINIQAKAVEQTIDPLALKRVQLAKHRIAYQVNDNRFCNYSDVRERWIGGALAARAWAYRWDFVPYLGSYGEVIPRLVDPRMLFIPDGYMTPHDPTCPRLHEVFRIPINEARSMAEAGWENTDNLKADLGSDILEWVQTGQAGPDTRRVYYSEGNDRATGMGGEGFATFCMTWYRFEFDTVKVERDVMLEPAMRFMECVRETCGFKSPRQYEIAQAAGDPNLTLPGRDTCAKCGATSVRRSKEIKTDEQMAYEKGKRLLIVCLNGSVEEPIYDGPWPAPDCPTFPYAWLTCEKEPHRLLPESDTSRRWSETVARNFTAQAIYEQVHSSRAIQLWPSIGIEDRNGIAVDDMDELADVLFYTSELPDNNPVKVIQGAPVAPALFQLYQLLHGSDKENESSSRIALSPDQSKDIPVGTIKALVKSGNVPVDSFMIALYNAESISFTCLLAYIRKFDTENRWIRFSGAKGGTDYAMIRGIDLPDADIICSAGPQISNIDEEAIKAITQLSGLPAPMRRLVGRAMRVDESLLDDMDEAQRLSAPVAPASGAPGAPTPAGPPATNGAVPQPMGATP